jgi:hypothetical protein
MSQFAAIEARATQYPADTNDVVWLVERVRELQDELSAWEALAALGPEWWPEVGRLTGGQWYCELCLGSAEPHNVGPAIRVIAPTAGEAIRRALAEKDIVKVWPN